jgi:phage terminase large subunit GpA-like protein
MGQGYMHFGNEKQGFDEKYFNMLTAEERRLRYINGRPQIYYHLPPDTRNESPDLWVYFFGIMDILPPNVKAVNENLLRLQPSATTSKDYVLKPTMEQSKKTAQQKPNATQEQRKSRVIGGRKGRLMGGSSGSAGINFGTNAGNIFK